MACFQRAPNARVRAREPRVRAPSSLTHDPFNPPLDVGTSLPRTQRALAPASRGFIGQAT
jgi:hypothetical protein